MTLWSLFLLFVVLALLLFNAIYKMRRRNRGKYPKTYKKVEVTPCSSFPEDLTRDRYLLKKVPKDIDVIIVGSGVSALTSGAILSKIGKKVLVIEQHYVAGGNLHAFTDKGYEFETGLHYVNAQEGKKIGFGLLNLVTSNKIEWCRLGREHPETMIYDKVYVGEDLFDFVSGRDELKKSLQTKFPNDAKAIETYFSEVRKASKVTSLPLALKILNNSFLYKIITKIFSRVWLKYFNTTVHNFISGLTKNRKLEAILCTQFGDYGLLPTEAPFFIHSQVVNHYFPGAHFPLGGPQEIARELIGTIYSNGGKVLVSKGVQSILVDDQKNQVVGVQMETGDAIGCNTVISTAGYMNTYKKLLPEKYSQGQLHKDLKETINTTSHCVVLFVGFKASVSELKLPTSNIWSYPNEYYEDWYPKYRDNPFENPGFYFIGFGSAKDADWEKKHPDKSTGIVITFCKRETFEKWENQEVKHRDKEYKSLKEKFIEKMLNEALYKYYPHLKEYVDYIDLGTPLSCEHFLGAYQGGIYGLDIQGIRFTKFNDVLMPKTKINGLWLSGQDVCTPGVVSSMLSGFVTSSALLGYGVTDLIAGRDLISELGNLHEAEKKCK